MVKNCVKGAVSGVSGPFHKDKEWFDEGCKVIHDWNEVHQLYMNWPLGEKQA
jgi:hypothetical protein